MVAASGDISLGEPPPGERGWKIAVAATDSTTNQASRVLFLRNCGVSTSGDAEQFIEIRGKRYSHIVNPKTGLGFTERIQATVLAPNATQSDSFATAVCVLGAQRGLRFIESQPDTAVFIVAKSFTTNVTFESKKFHQHSNER